MRRNTASSSIALIAAALALAASAMTHAASASKAHDPYAMAKQTIELPNGITMAYAEYGATRGTPTILLHGYTNNSREWIPLLPHLDPRLRLILVDLRGHGASSKPECCYMRLDFAYDVMLLLDALHVQRANIVGQSLGSLVAQTFAEFWPERVDRVILMSSTGGPAPPQELNAKPPGPMLGHYDILVHQLTDPIDPDSAFMRDWYAAPAMNEEFLRLIRRDSAAIPANIWKAILDQGALSLNLQATLPRLKAQTLLIWGENDSLMTPPSRQTLIDGLPQAKVVTLPGLGHTPFWENPKLVAVPINDFLTGP